MTTRFRSGKSSGGMEMRGHTRKETAAKPGEGTGPAAVSGQKFLYKSENQCYYKFGYMSKF